VAPLTGHRVFVYGSLRRGERHHDVLGDARFLGVHRSTASFTMLDLGAYPGVVEGGSTAITGEVYQIGAQRLRLLDRFEGCPREFRRTWLTTPWGKAWIYLLGIGRPRRVPRVASGDWRRRRR